MPALPIRFVNTTVDALAKFIDAHANYTNRIIGDCQLEGRANFEMIFAREIVALVAEFQAIDPKAVASRDNWWPHTVDPKLAEYRRGTT
jgi:hypothetical protein